MGAFCDLIDQSKPPKPKFSVDDIPDLTGKVVIVTGGNTGVGKETCRALLNHNAKVYLAARSQEKAMVAIQELQESTGKEAIFLKLDLGNLRAVKQAFEDFMSRETHLHILYNNAGVITHPIEDLTSDGYDLQFGTNVLGHWYFTHLLTPTLLATTSACPAGTIRVVMTSSSVHMLGKGEINFETLHEGSQPNTTRRKLGTREMYCQSKLGNVVSAKEYARRYGDQGIVFTSCNPGNLKTDLQRYHSGITHSLMDIILYPAPMGALTQLYAGTSPETADANGEYFIPWARHGKASAVTDDPELGKRLWEWCEQQVVRVQ